MREPDEIPLNSDGSPRLYALRAAPARAAAAATTRNGAAGSPGRAEPSAVADPDTSEGPGDADPGFAERL
ncbi:hypothetical protein SVIOM342S_07539 [Streptomyces violaceorubidus]